MNLTATALITDALVKLTVLRFGQTPTSDLLAGGLQAVQDMIDGWQIDELQIYSILTEVFTLTSSRIYTIGPTGDFATVRPNRVEEANYLFTSTPSSIVRKPIAILSAYEWSLIGVQQISNAVVDAMYYQNNFTQPDGNGTIQLWPGAPAGNQLELFTWRQLQSFADATTVYGFPPGYPEAMKWGVSEKLLPMVDIYIKGDKAAVTALVINQAQKTKTALQGYNYRELYNVCDPAYVVGRKNGGAFNYLTGGFGRSL